jgi:hypothetical protein
MSEKFAKIIDGLKNLNAKGHYNSSAIIHGTVDKVNGIDTINVEVEGVMYNKVQLQAIIDGSGNSIIMIPSKSSKVLIGNIENGTNYVLLKADKVDRILMKQVDGMAIDIIKGVVKLNGDGKGGLVTVQALVSKINALENDLNMLKTSFTAWVPVPTDGGAALKAVVAAWAAMAIIPTQRMELENKKVKHGG